MPQKVRPSSALPGRSGASSKSISFSVPTVNSDREGNFDSHGLKVGLHSSISSEHHAESISVDDTMLKGSKESIRPGRKPSSTPSKSRITSPASSTKGEHGKNKAASQLYHYILKTDMEYHGYTSSESSESESEYSPVKHVPRIPLSKLPRSPGMGSLQADLLTKYRAAVVSHESSSGIDDFNTESFRTQTTATSYDEFRSMSSQAGVFSRSQKKLLEKAIGEEEAAPEAMDKQYTEKDYEFERAPSNFKPLTTRESVMVQLARVAFKSVIEERPKDIVVVEQQKSRQGYVRQDTVVGIVSSDQAVKRDSRPSSQQIKHSLRSIRAVKNAQKARKEHHRNASVDLEEKFEDGAETPGSTTRKEDTSQRLMKHVKKKLWEDSKEEGHLRDSLTDSIDLLIKTQSRQNTRLVSPKRRPRSAPSAAVIRGSIATNRSLRHRNLGNEITVGHYQPSLVSTLPPARNMEGEWEVKTLSPIPNDEDQAADSEAVERIPGDTSDIPSLSLE